MRPPGPELERCELTHLTREPIDLELAGEQHAAYCAALEEAGLAVRRLESLPAHPDGCFVEDPALVLDEVAVITRPGAASRVGETRDLEAHLVTELALEHLPAGVHLEGGDVLEVEDVLYTGLSSRTDHGGMKALAHLVLGHGYRVKAVGVEGCLHLKTAVTYLGQGTLLANPNWADLSRFSTHSCIEVHQGEPGGANALKLGDRLVMSTEFPRTADRVEAAGFKVVRVALSEFHKAEAGPTCLSLLLPAAAQK